MWFACAAVKAEANSIAAPLTAAAGDAARGRAIVANRQLGLCLLCHSGPIPEERFQGNLAPPLDGAGARWSAGQLRMRMVDAGKFNPETIMPSYFKPGSAARTPAALQGRTILSAQQVEDVVAYLQTLGAPP
jgi:sulfur-oxidizing protein SoxX